MIDNARIHWSNGKPQVATEEDCKAYWGGEKDGKRFRCYLCGHKFIPGDVWRFVASQTTINFMVCQLCDGPDVMERWLAANQELRTRFWWR